MATHGPDFFNNLAFSLSIFLISKLICGGFCQYAANELIFKQLLGHGSKQNSAEMYCSLDFQ